jgi:uncharacterized protein
MMDFDITRRDFLRTVSAASLTGAAASGVFAADTAKEGGKDAAVKEKKEPRYPQVPRRELGKTGLSVPILSLGAMYNVVDNQIGLRKTLAHNANYWDTAHSYAGGNSETGIGKFLARYPEKRQEVIIATKASGARDSAGRDEKLATSLERMHTDYIDIYYGIHAMSSPDQLTDDLKEWSIEAKKSGKIRHFGFTTHKNMTECLNRAAECDWIDVIMVSFNFRLMQDQEYMAAFDRCHKAGIGLVAMKVMTRGQELEGDDAKLLEGGLTPGQAKIKIVLDDERIASACVGMDTMTKLNENINVALDHGKLSEKEKLAIADYACRTSSSYCAGCGKCAKASPMPYTPEVMRYMMYYNNYSGEGDKQMARSLYSRIPQSYREQMAGFDYSLAESFCPQGVKISGLIAKASRVLA